MGWSTYKVAFQEVNTEASVIYCKLEWDVVFTDLYQSYNLDGAEAFGFLYLLRIF